VETRKKERKGLFGLFGSKKAYSEGRPTRRPPPSISFQTPPAAAVLSQTVDADRQELVEEVRDSEAHDCFN
jgi:hypothetical protein